MEESEILEICNGSKMGRYFESPMGFHVFANILLVIDEVLYLEVSNLGRQVIFKPESNDENREIHHLTMSMWFRNMELTIVRSTSSSARPVHDRKNQVEAAKLLESMVYRLTQEGGRWPFLTPGLEIKSDKTKETAPPLIV